ncbi:hypothetical protein IFM89_013088, partial [Coptis chinensis]
MHDAKQNKEVLTNYNRHYYYPYLMGASKVKTKNEMQLTSVARAIKLDNDISLMSK